MNDHLTRWEYTYHGRLKNYGQWKESEDGVSKVKGISAWIDRGGNHRCAINHYPPGSDDHMDA